MSNDRTPTSDEVLRRIGRNLVIFQQIESLLKFILKSSDTTHVLPDGASALVDTSADGRKSAQQTLGVLVRTYLSDVLVKTGSEKPEPELPESAQCAFRFTFRRECEDALVQRMREDLKLMTEQRNELVHHFLQGSRSYAPAITATEIAFTVSHLPRHCSPPSVLCSFLPFWVADGNGQANGHGRGFRGA